MKQLILLLLIIIINSIVVYGQPNCAIGFMNKSNQIIYNEYEIEKLIEPTQYDAFFFGERHNIDFEPEFKYHFIRHLNSKYGIRDVFMEMGYAAAYFFNQYLQTGDTSIVKENHLIYLWGHYKDFWRNLYQYNTSLPDSLKIRIHGIDFERTEIFKLLEKTIDKNKPIPNYLQQTFVDIQTLSNNNTLAYNDKAFKEEYHKLQFVFEKYQGDFKILYGENFDIINNAVKNKTPITTSVKPRNKAWFRNIEPIITSNKISKFIAFVGAAHTDKNYARSINLKLSNSKFFTGKTVTITAIYSHQSTKEGHKISKYLRKEQEVFDKYYDPTCRGVIIKSIAIDKSKIQKAADYVLFAKDKVEE